MFPVEPMTQPKLLPIQGEAAAVAMPWEREEGDLSPRRGGFLITKLLTLFLGSMGLLASSLEVSILTC